MANKQVALQAATLVFDEETGALVVKIGGASITLTADMIDLDVFGITGGAGGAPGTGGKTLKDVVAALNAPAQANEAGTAAAAVVAALVAGASTASTPGDSVVIPATAGGITILAAKAGRLGAAISNADTTKAVWLSLGGTPVFGKGILLGAGAVLTCGSEYKGAIAGITDSGTVTLGISEF